LVEKRLDLPSSNFVHVGDCLKRDFQNPLLAGWQAVHLPVSDAERLARRKNHLETEKHLQREYSISVDIAMPL
jgi:FMN phosphatase YigB (HAD superfamily)